MAYAIKRESLIALKRSFLPLLLLLIMLVAAHPLSAADTFDHSLWARFLSQFVDADGNVDYAKVKQDPSLLEDYLQQIQFIDHTGFNDWPREEKLALLINAYNAGVIKMVVDHYPIKSLQDIPGVWNLPVIHLGARVWSLNDLRQSQLIGNFADEKIHAALACGAVSCPRLMEEPYDGMRVEGQLYLATKLFVNDPKYNRFHPREGKIEISSIFKWYRGDFVLDFGFYGQESRKFDSEELAVLSFLAYYVDNADVIQFLNTLDYDVKYIPFDWTLNDRRMPEKGA